MNKTFKLYGIIFIIVMVILTLLEFSKTTLTDWRKNFDIEEKSPFGLFVFNNEVDKLLNNDVKRTTLSPYNYYRENKNKLHNILLIQSTIDYESWNKILENVSEGSNALVFSDNFDSKLADSLGFKPSYPAYIDSSILKLTDKKFTRDSLVIDKLPTGIGFISIKKNHEILGKEAGKDGLANFIKIKHGKGFIYLHSEPLILTNYYLLKPENERYLQSLFSLLPLRETIWFVGANDEAFESNSVLRFILSKPALRYAWWLLLGGLLLFIIFNAKRKQRIVPIIEPLTNKSVEFVKSIGNLYLQEGDLHDMMAKKAQYFLYHVRTDLLIDTKNLDDNFEKMLHSKTGESMDKIKKTTDFIKKAQNPNASVVKEDLIKMNELLDDILN